MTKLEKEAADLFNDMMDIMESSASFQKSRLKELVDNWLKQYNATCDHRNNAVKMLRQIFPDNDPFRVDL